MRLLWYAHFKGRKIHWIEHRASPDFCLGIVHACKNVFDFTPSCIFLRSTKLKRLQSKCIDYSGVVERWQQIYTDTHIQFTVIYLLILSSTCCLLRSKHWLMFNSLVCLVGVNGVADALIKVSLTFQTIGVEKSGNVSVSECIFLWRKAISAELTARWATNWSRCRILAILFLI